MWELTSCEVLGQPEPKEGFVAWFVAHFGSEPFEPKVMEELLLARAVEKKKHMAWHKKMLQNCACWGEDGTSGHGATNAWLTFE